MRNRPIETLRRRAARRRLVRSFLGAVRRALAFGEAEPPAERLDDFDRRLRLLEAIHQQEADTERALYHQRGDEAQAALLTHSALLRLYRPPRRATVQGRPACGDQVSTECWAAQHEKCSGTAIYEGAPGRCRCDCHAARAEGRP